MNRIAEGIAKAEAEIVTMKAVTTEQTAISEKSGKSKARCRAEERFPERNVRRVSHVASETKDGQCQTRGQRNSNAGRREREE